MKVTKVYPDVGPWGSSAIVCELEDGRIYIPYFNDAASDMCCRDAEWPRDKDWIVESYSHWAGTTDEEVVERAFRTYGCPCEACKIEQDPGIWLDSMYEAIDLPEVGDEINVEDPEVERHIHNELPMY